MHFRDRIEAGKKIAEKLVKKYKNSNTVVYALPRGGVVLGVEIARELNAPLDLVITRKIGHPMQPEYAVCAIGERDGLVCSELERPNLDQKWLEREVEKGKKETKRRRELYMKGKTIPVTKDTIAILVDDGVATGLTMEVAIAEIAAKGVTHIIVAVPVIPSEMAYKFKKKIEDLVALDVPTMYLGSVGAYYSDFPQVEDKEVIELINTFNK
ncbi:phosphoribosyl transferase [Candidatus Wolfebacteria bacterium]|nr:MAG: phosphoribosyl transferase [Candidatus Wolfebacteria bacterium]